jgi:hypothetical protein
MAGLLAVQTTCKAVIELLRQSYRPELIGTDQVLEFEVYGTEKFKSHMTAGVSLFLYRVYANANQRSPLSPDAEGRLRRTQLPLDLHFFLTVWAKDASLQHALVGWMMRALEDFPVLPSALLNGAQPGVFQDDETVEIVIGQLNNEELMRIWDDLSTEYQLSVPYIARVVRIDSVRDVFDGEPVIRRDLRFGANKS